MSHVPTAFVPALPLAPEEQATLVRFLAGRDCDRPVAVEWVGAFAAVPALRRHAAKQE